MKLEVRALYCSVTSSKHPNLNSFLNVDTAYCGRLRLTLDVYSFSTRRVSFEIN